jgi:Family of unknown function (DUF6544)
MPARPPGIPDEDEVPGSNPGGPTGGSHCVAKPAGGSPPVTATRRARYGDEMTIVTEERISGLPPPVQRSLRHSGAVGAEVPETVTLRQRGELLIRNRWFPFTAVQSYTLDPPGFRWRARVKVARLPLAIAEDSLEHGSGRMHVRVLGLVPVVDATGPEMDQGSLMRWLNETMWFPQAWTTDVISWRPLDENSAIGSVSAGGHDVEAAFRFDDDGRLVDFRADRYRAVGGGFELAEWATPLSAHSSFAGVEVPSAGHASWILDDGESEYIRLQITDVHYRASR